MTDLDQKIKDIATEVYAAQNADSQFSLSNTSFHTHNGQDSIQVNFANLTNRLLLATAYLPGTTLAQNINSYGVFFVAPFNCVFMAASEVHTTANGSDINVVLEKLVGTQATGSGTQLLTAGFNLNGTANTVKYGTLAIVPKIRFSLKKGDRLGLTLGGGSLTSIANVLITCTLSF